VTCKAALVTDTRYRERLTPRWWAWLLAFSLMLMLAIAYGAAFGDTVGWVLVGGGAVLVIFLLILTAPRVELTDEYLLVDDARLPLGSISSAAVVTSAEMRALRGPGADARLFVALRPWSAPAGVYVLLDDADDPHPAWLFTSRHPARLTAAITATMNR
jgi:hypothetical protein